MSFDTTLVLQAQKCFQTSKGSHDWDHSLRVHKLSLKIGEIEKANMQVLSTAAYLHDIARKIQDDSQGKICHAEMGAVMAKTMLTRLNLNQTFINEVVHCIKTHRYRGQNIPESLEAKVLFDADKLDSIGAVGIGRTFLYAGEIGAKLYNKDKNLAETKQYTPEATAYREFALKLKYIKDRMLTQAGKRLAQERHDFMMLFFERMNLEVDGN